MNALGLVILLVGAGLATVVVGHMLELHHAEWAVSVRDRFAAGRAALGRAADYMDTER